MIKIKVLLAITAIAVSFFLGTISYKFHQKNDIPEGWIDDGTVCLPIDTK